MINFNNMISDSQKSFPKLILMLIVSACFNSAYAQQHEGFSAVIAANIGHDDNIFRSSEELSDEFIQLAPALKLTELYESVQLGAQYKGNYRQYNDLSDLSYAEHDASLKGQYKHTAKFTSELTLRYSSKIEEPGTTNAASSVLDEFSEISSSSLKAAGTYGTQKSIGQIRVAYDLDKRRYDNNSQSFRDYDSDRLTGTFYYRLAPKTRLLLEASIDDLNYKNTETFDASSKQNRYLMGVEWTATAKTTGIFKIGYQDINYDNDLLNDISGLAYYLDMTWKPNTYSSIKLGAERSTRESAIQGLPSFISENYSIEADHKFSPKSKVGLGYSYSVDDFGSSQGRSDNLSAISAEYTYALKRSLEVYLDYTHKKRSSNLILFDYDSNIYMLGIDWLID
ncbi:outer membrane beta-barrel protein [Aliiglaciecola sp. 2_MG-2023]|uniref:outer membrane beta-barrel protein n=1 Tax=unclassified Aliiglaciecola TaxID=2593648 RepID=UPI0026E35E95|nr:MULTISPECIES: outer membrane beta-barrel protein [unclassified Aliiglaciecola]MDO6712865.1 outer membrane beta-barrel protein [Aliiglaciecola sp. 2_MG-2023]MDO6752899.1 outer membrane beta-barrel protein [Aliiglaciecola sp. 1_MG-2023]